MTVLIRTSPASLTVGDAFFKIGLTAVPAALVSESAAYVQWTLKIRLQKMACDMLPYRRWERKGSLA